MDLVKPLSPNHPLPSLKAPNTSLSAWVSLCQITAPRPDPQSLPTPRSTQELRFGGHGRGVKQK